MATSEERIDNLEEKYSNLHTVVNVLAAKVDATNDKIDATNDKIDNFISEMRNKDNQRQAEIIEIRNDIKEIYKTTDAKFGAIQQSFQTMQNQNVVVIIGVIAIAVAVFLKQAQSL